MVTEVQNEVPVILASNLAGLEPDLVKQCGRSRFWFNIELGAEDICAGVIMAQRRSALTTPHIAPHHDAMGILAAWVMTQQTPRLLQTCTVIAHTILSIRQIGKDA